MSGAGADHCEVGEADPTGEVGQARDAAARVIAAFAAHDAETYFAGFAEDATFLFHNHPGLLVGREAYRSLWREWEAEGFHVESCTSHAARCDLVAPDVAVFTHRVRTVLRGEGEQRERETIVLARRGAGWIAVHEHLSPDPGDPEDLGYPGDSDDVVADTGAA